MDKLYICDTFIDYAGNQREFVMCAIVESYKEPLIYIGREDSDDDYIYKAISIGIAAKRPGDTFSETLGRKIALGKALKKSTHRILVTNHGMIDQELVSRILEKEANYFKYHPESYLKGYNKDKERFLVKSTMEDKPLFEKLDPGSRLYDNKQVENICKY